jgi:hypothetical protein
VFIADRAPSLCCLSIRQLFCAASFKGNETELLANRVASSCCLPAASMFTQPGSFHICAMLLLGRYLLSLVRHPVVYCHLRELWNANAVSALPMIRL